MYCVLCRSVEVIKKQWEEQREKLVLDYKKKTREVSMSKVCCYWSNWFVNDTVEEEGYLKGHHC